MFMKVTTVPDMYSTGLPSVMEQCFSNIQQRRQSEVTASQGALRTNLGQLGSGLHQCLLRLLKAKGCRARVLEWIGVTLCANVGRGKMQIDTLRNASHGFFCNLSTVMLKLCEPFIDPLNGPGLVRIDLSYLSQVSKPSPALQV